MKMIKSFYTQLTEIFRIVIIFFLICSLLLFAWGSVVINKQLQENAKVELLLFAKDCDYIFDSVFKSSLNIRNYIEDNYKESLRNNIRLDNRGNITQFIESQSGVLDSVAEIFVYDLNGRVFTKYGVFDEESIYYAYYDIGDNDFNKWRSEIESLNGESVGKINTSTILDISHSESKTLEYMRYYNVKGQPIVVVYEMPLASFLRGKYENGRYGIMLPDSEVYFGTDLIMDAVKGIENDNENDMVPFWHNKSLYVMSHYFSNTYTCKYIYVQSYKAYFDYVIKYGGVFLGLTMIFLLLAVWFSRWSSRRTVEPIKAVMREISLDNSYSQNEMMNILSYLKKNKQEVAQYKGLIEQYNNKMQSVGIEHILTNFIYSPEKEDLFDKYKLTFPFDNYYVAIFKINKNDLDNVISEINEFLMQLCGDSGICYNVQIGGIVASIVNCNSDLCPVLENKAEILRQNIREMYGNDLEIVVSERVTSISEIHKKYIDCLEDVNADDKYKIINSEILNKYGIGEDSIDILSMCIKSGQIDYALLFFDAIANSQLCYLAETAEVKQMFYAILSQILVCHNDTITDLLLGYEKCHDVTDMIEYVKHTIEKVSKGYVKREINKRILLQLNVLKYIKDNLEEQKMSVAGIADKFEMSPSYISKQFKSLFSIALLEYIQKARINEAARLLIYSEMSLNELSNNLGFVNTNVFIRLFKKLAGTTPGAFRKTHTDGKN